MQQRKSLKWRLENVPVGKLPESRRYTQGKNELAAAGKIAASDKSFLAPVERV